MTGTQRALREWQDSGPAWRREAAAGAGFAAGFAAGYDPEAIAIIEAIARYEHVMEHEISAILATRIRSTIERYRA